MLLVLVGLVILGVGVAFVVRGIRRDFEKQLSLPAGKLGDGIRTLGIVGYVAKGIAIAVVGVLFVVAAVTHDPEKAGGLDAALKSLAALPVRAGDPLARRRGTRDLRHLLLRAGAVRPALTVGSRTVTAT